jgi:putative (di)nucleoside polyphosphate hydrolase
MPHATGRPHSAEQVTMKPFRRNVCAVLVNEDRSRVLVFRRVGKLLPGHRWQFPQGGLRARESPEEGLRRELDEEIGTADVEVLGRARDPIRYEYPAQVVRKLKAEGSKLARFRGQEQHWFLVRLRGGTRYIHFDHQPRELDAFRWVAPARALELVVPFKRAAYRMGLHALGLLGRRASAPDGPQGRVPRKPTGRAPGKRISNVPGNPQGQVPGERATRASGKPKGRTPGTRAGRTPR